MKVQAKVAAAVLFATASILGPMSSRAATPAGVPPAAALPAATAPRAPTAPAVPVAPRVFVPSAVLDEIDLRDVPLRDALSLISQPSGMNLAASEQAAKMTVTLRLRNVSPYTAVEALCQTHGLYFKKPTAEDNIGVITTLKEFQEGLTVFREEKTEVFTLLYPNATDLAVAIHDLFGDRVRVSLGKEDVLDESDEIQRRFSKFDLLDQRSQGLTSSFGSGGGGSSSGGNSSSSSNRSSSSGSGSRGSLSGLNQRSDNPQRENSELQNLSPEQLSRLSSLLRQEGAGVGVDAEKLIGLRQNSTPIYVSVINRNNQLIVRTSDPSVLEEVGRLKAKIDIPTPQVLLEVKVLSVDLTDGFRSVFDIQFAKGNNASSFTTGDILPPPGVPNSLAIGGTGGGSFPLDQTSLIYQWVNDNFRLRMQLLDNRNRVTTLATPLLLVANNEVSRVFVGEERPIVRNISSQTTATQGVVTNTPNTTIEFRPVGTTLLITPNINADRTVTLRLVQEKSDIIPGGATIPVVGNNGSVTNQPVDVVSARTLTGTLIAKDGLSLALGGLIEEGVTDNREEVPILGRLPVVGYLFRRQVTGRYRHEVIIVIRPYILSTPSEAAEVGKRLTDAHSLHPTAENLNPAPGQPIGTMKTYLQHEVLRPNAPVNELQKTFRFHNVLPRNF